jgi:non-heme chloroperoxidase
METQSIWDSLIERGSVEASCLCLIQGDADQIMPIDDSGHLTVKIVKNAKLEVIPGAPHGLCITHADVVNQHLLAFFKS